MSEANAVADSVFAAVKSYIDARVAIEVETKVAATVAALQEVRELDEETLEERLTVRLRTYTADYFDKLPKPKDGAPGKDADPVDVPKIAGIVEHATAIRARALIEELFAAVPKAKDGEPGPPGKDAPPVDEDALNERVAAMVYHVVGKAIKTIPLPKDGEPGQEGEPGRDAVQIEILDAIDERKRYARTTYARHDGGIWFAAKTTTPLEAGESREPVDHGWICVVAGIAGLDITVDLEAREMTVETRRSGGEIEKQIVYMPILLDRGVYNATKDYERFDITSHDGSGWIAQCATKDVPGTSKSWRLFVMRGRNGKDANRAPIPSADVVRLR